MESLLAKFKKINLRIASLIFRFKTHALARRIMLMRSQCADFEALLSISAAESDIKIGIEQKGSYTF
jgi:hypothetical protein